MKEIIRKKGSKWEVRSEDGSKLLGTHDTKEDAEKQLKAIEIAKHQSIISKIHERLMK